MAASIKSSVQQTAELAIANVSGMLLGVGGSAGKKVRQINIDVEETDNGYVAVLTYDLEEADAHGDDDVRNPKRRGGPDAAEKAEQAASKEKQHSIYREHLAVKTVRQARALQSTLPVPASGMALSYALRPTVTIRPSRTKALADDHPALDLLWEKQYEAEMAAAALSEDLKNDFVQAELDTPPAPQNATRNAKKHNAAGLSAAAPSANMPARDAAADARRRHPEGEEGPAPEPS